MENQTQLADKTSFFIVFLLLFFLFSCQPEEQSGIAIIPVSISPVEQNNRKINIEKIIPLENKKEAIFGRPARITLTDNRIIIFDNRGRGRLFLFDTNGKFLARTQKGRGVGECLQPSDYYYNDVIKEIQIFDLGNDKMLYYDLNLKFKYAEKVSSNLFFRDFKKLKNGEWLVHYQNKLRESDDDGKIYSYLKYSADLKTITAQLLPDDKVPHRILHVINPLSKEEGITLLCRPFDQYIYAFNGENKVSKQYFLDFGDYSITQTDIDQGVTHTLELKKKDKRVTVLGDVINSDPYVACSFVYKQESQYVIYNKKTKETICSLGLNTLPYGELKGMKDENTFVLLVKALELKDFAAANDLQFEDLASIPDEGNDIIVLFNIPS